MDSSIAPPSTSSIGQGFPDIEKEPTRKKSTLQVSYGVVGACLVFLVYVMSPYSGQRATTSKVDVTVSSTIQTEIDVTKAVATTPRKVPVVDTSSQVRLGHGYWTLDSRCLKKRVENKPLIVYGVGAGNDISFDVDMVNKYGAESYIFDPTIESIDYVSSQIESYKDSVTFVPEGLSTVRGTITFTSTTSVESESFTPLRAGVHSKSAKDMVKANVNTLENWMKQFNHEYLDVLKLNIEGSEYTVLQDLIDRKYLPFTQLLVEFHNRIYSLRNERRHNKVWDGLLQAGFVPFSKTINGQVVGFIKKRDIPYCYGFDIPRMP